MGDKVTNEMARRKAEAEAPAKADVARAEEKMKIGYIGSPGNMKDANIKRTIVDLLSKLKSRGAQIYVGPPNAGLTEAIPGNVLVQDMNEASIDMFNAIIITPGGPGAEK